MILNNNSPQTSTKTKPAMATARFNLAEIRWSLKQTQLQFRRINKSLNARRNALTDEMVGNLLAGYQYIDHLLGSDTELLANGQSHLLLELNTLVLCGSDATRREEYASHIRHNSEYYYNNPGGGIGGLMEWYLSRRGESVWELAAGVYIQMLTQPQLFIEGNHRSAILVVSYLLGREGHPPFVLTPGNAKALLNETQRIERLRKHSLNMLVSFSRLRNHLVTILQAGIEPRHSRLA